jgi:hypothetical protein
MKLLKMLGLSMVVAVAASAFIGVGSASAVLCKANESPCSAANQYPVPTEVTVASPATKLSNSLGFVTLCESKATLKHEGESAGKLFGTFVKLEWPNCTEGCKKVTTTALGTFKDEAIGGGNGKLFPEGTTVLLQECPLGAECTAKAISGTTFLTMNGGTINGTANATAKTTVSISGGGLCGTSGTWETEKPYVVTSVNGSTSGSIFQE